MADGETEMSIGGWLLGGKRKNKDGTYDRRHKGAGAANTYNKLIGKGSKQQEKKTKKTGSEDEVGFWALIGNLIKLCFHLCVWAAQLAFKVFQFVVIIPISILIRRFNNKTNQKHVTEAEKDLPK
jgi:hypothetical protein